MNESESAELERQKIHSSQIAQENERKTAHHKTRVEGKQLELRAQKRLKETRCIQNCTRVEHYHLR